MAVAFREKATLGYGTHTNSTLNKPTGTADDDILVAAWGGDTNETVTAPAGWTEYAGSPFTVAFGFMRVYWKRAATEGASWTWSHSSTGTFATVLAYSGAIGIVDPNDVAPSNNTGGSNKNAIATGITIATLNALGIILWTFSADPGAVTPPAGFTEHGDPANTFGAEDALLPAGATGDLTSTTTNNVNWFAFFLALSPPASSGVSGNLNRYGRTSIIPFLKKDK